MPYESVDQSVMNDEDKNFEFEDKTTHAESVVQTEDNTHAESDVQTVSGSSDGILRPQEKSNDIFKFMMKSRVTQVGEKSKVKFKKPRPYKKHLSDQPYSVSPSSPSDESKSKMKIKLKCQDIRNLLLMDNQDNKMDGMGVDGSDRTREK